MLSRASTFQGVLKTGSVSLVLAICISMLILTACGQLQGKSSKVILKHPETLDFQTCEVNALMTKKSYDEKDACIEEYKEQGYVIWGER